MHFDKRIEEVQKTISVRPTQMTELALILAWEKAEPNVSQWGLEKHRDAISDPNIMHHTIFLVKSEIPVGYAILKKNSPDDFSVEFMRLVIGGEFKGQGYGSLYFEYIWDNVFSGPHVLRIWHDVFAENSFAIRLYERLGYTRFKEGVDQASGRPIFFYELSKQSYLARIA